LKGDDEPSIALTISAHISSQAMMKLDDEALAVVIDAEPVSVKLTTWLVESVNWHEFEGGLTAIETPTITGAPLVDVALAPMVKYIG
jgi:hypothetical protein